MSSRLQTLLIITIAISAGIGGIAGAIGSTLFTSRFAVAPQELTPERVDQKIVELIEEESATIAVVERVTPAVVSIVVKKERGQLGSQSQQIGSTPFFIQPAPLSEEEAGQLVEISSGSGFFVSEDGLLLTNRHVVDESDAQFFVVTNNGEELEAELIDTDPFQDIAILRAKGENFPVATLGDSEQIQIGQTVIAIGNTLSEFRNTVTKGVISGINRRVTAGTAASAEVIEQAIQTDAAINPGNSGGPLINLRGEVVGINTAVSVQGEAIAFAIPINQAKRAIEDVRELGRIVRPWLGIRYVLVEPSDIEESDDSFDVGAMIVAGTQPGQPGVIPGSPAALAELQEGDVIIKINDFKLTKEKSLSERISQFRPGDNVKLEVFRKKKIEIITVTLAEFDDE